MTPLVNHVFLVVLVVLFNDNLSDATAIRASATASSSSVLSNVTQRHDQFGAAAAIIDGSVGYFRSGRHNAKSRRIFTADELVHTRFPSRISDDIDMDPCKSGGFVVLN